MLLLLLFPAPNGNAASWGTWIGTDVNGLSCTIAQGYGPYDYTDPATAARRRSVEQYHFTPQVEQLIGGASTVSIYGDLDYTIRAFPNHHRALYALVKLQLQSGKSLPIRPECYLDRAIAFNRTDGVVHAIYGLYLHQLGRYKAALRNYKRAEELIPDYAELAYNMGLLYLDMGDHEKAQHYAKIAYAANYPLPGLRNRLAREGHPLGDR